MDTIQNKVKSTHSFHAFETCRKMTCPRGFCEKGNLRIHVNYQHGQFRTWHECLKIVFVINHFKQSKVVCLLPFTMYIHLPVMELAVTMIFVRSAYTTKTLCVVAPYRARMTCKNVFAPGARIFNCTETMANRRIWIVAPAAYQNGPLIPYCNSKTFFGFNVIVDGKNNLKRFLPQGIFSNSK